MTISVKNAGTWALVLNVLINQAGAWTPVQKVHFNNAGTWAEVYAAEVVATVSANQVNLNVQSLFTADDWASTKKKRVVINSGVKVYSNTTATAALLTGSGRGGLLQIDNNGEIQGAGGVPNSGAGGHAINVQQTGLTINNYGGIRGGGGAGGVGGTGGAGGTGVYTAQDGPAYSGSSYYWMDQSDSFIGSLTIIYFGGQVYRGSRLGNGVSIGGYNYYKGTLQSSSSGQGSSSSTWAVYRQYNVYVGGAGGGAGGAGGYGQGGNVNATVGNNGAGGGNNGGNSGTGGTGGKGGTGGTWGAAGTAGATGGTGAAGNAGGGGGGYAGGAGGAAGYALIGQARTLNNFGTINGTNG